MECLATIIERAENWKNNFEGGVIVYYDGAMPASPEKDEGSAEAVVIFTNDALPHSDGSVANGIAYLASSNEVVLAPNTYLGKVLKTATPVWARIYDKNHTTGASTSAFRRDIAIGSVSELAVDAIVQLTGFTLSFPR